MAKTNLAFQNWAVSSAGSAVDTHTYGSGGRYTQEDLSLFSFTVENRQSRVSNVVGKNVKNVNFDYNKYQLFLRVPPTEITYTYNKEITRTKVRSGWVIERWGDTLLSIEASGTTGMFFLGDEGVTRENAYRTQSYAELMELVQIYKNNGMSYSPDHGVIDTVGVVKIQYDGYTYLGSFDAFTLSESAEKPFYFDYSFSFVSRGIASDEMGTYVTGHYFDAQNVEADSSGVFAASRLTSAGIGGAVVGLDAQAEKLVNPDQAGRTNDPLAPSEDLPVSDRGEMQATLDFNNQLYSTVPGYGADGLLQNINRGADPRTKLVTLAVNYREPITDTRNINLPIDPYADPTLDHDIN